MIGRYHCTKIDHVGILVGDMFYHVAFSMDGILPYLVHFMYQVKLYVNVLTSTECEQTQVQVYQVDTL